MKGRSRLYPISIIMMAAFWQRDRQMQYMQQSQMAVG